MHCFSTPRLLFLRASWGLKFPLLRCKQNLFFGEQIQSSHLWLGSLPLQNFWAKFLELVGTVMCFFLSNTSALAPGYLAGGWSCSLWSSQLGKRTSLYKGARRRATGISLFSVHCPQVTASVPWVGVVDRRDPHWNPCSKSPLLLYCSELHVP